MVSTTPASPLMDNLGGPLYREVQSIISGQKEASALLRRLLAGGETELDIVNYFGDEVIQVHVRNLLDTIAGRPAEEHACQHGTTCVASD